MRVRTALLGIGASVAILVAGCSAAIPGTPEGPNGQVSSGTGVATSSLGGAGDGDTGGDTGNGGTGGNTGLPGVTDLSQIPGLTGIPTALTGLSNIPGVSGQCLAMVNVFIAVSSLFLGPTLGGQALTQQQVDQAFQGMNQAPAELQDDIKTLHDAADQAVGKTPAQALAILTADPVTKALNALSDYTDTQCGNK
jgi:hypothetical protein